MPHRLEISGVRKLQDYQNTFHHWQIERIIKYRLRRTGSNTTSMLQAVRAGKQTDIDFLNGYLIRRATELGMDCSKNQMLLHLVKSKQAISNREKIMYIPFVN